MAIKVRFEFSIGNLLIEFQCADCSVETASSDTDRDVVGASFVSPGFDGSQFLLPLDDGLTALAICCLWYGVLASDSIISNPQR